MFAPAGTPKDVVAKINGETTGCWRRRTVRERISKEGADPVGSSPEQFDMRIRGEIEKWAKVVKAVGPGAAIARHAPAQTPPTAARSAPH